ncbi:hypothetical protein [Niastella caeni]|nr:hypothetical protein [Niastella caeni]
MIIISGINKIVCIGTIVSGLLACNPAFSQDVFFLRDGKVISDSSFRIESGNKRRSIRIGSSSSDSVFLPLPVKVINIASIENVYGLMLETEDKYYIYLGNLNKIFVQRGQRILNGKVVGQVLFDSSFHLNLLDISIKKDDKDLDPDEILNYLRFIK